MILAVLQARVTSTRLPGKVLKLILNKPMILLQIERVKRSKKIDALVVATSNEPSDDALEQFCKENNLNCYRGDLNDVLDRFYQATKLYSPQHVVRLTGDCPLADPDVIDNVIQKHINENLDYTSNTLEPTFPDGLDVEVFKFSALEKAWNDAKLPSEREHVTPFINKKPELFKLGSFKQDNDLSNLRWTVDEIEDFQLIETIYNKLYLENPAFTTTDILDCLESNPSLRSFNQIYERNEGLIKSLKEDENFLKKQKV